MMREAKWFGLICLVALLSIVGCGTSNNEQALDGGGTQFDGDFAEEVVQDQILTAIEVFGILAPNGGKSAASKSTVSSMPGVLISCPSV